MKVEKINILNDSLDDGDGLNEVVVGFDELVTKV